MIIYVHKKKFKLGGKMKINKLYLLLIFVPISIIIHFAGIGNESIQFFITALAIIPLAGLLGEATEELANYTSQKFGGFLGATFGNVTELLLVVFSLKEGLFDVVKASLAGSMIGNVLLVLGLSMFCGGLKHKTQKFSKKGTNVSVTLLTFAVLSLIIPAVCTGNISMDDLNPIKYESLSIAIALIMFITYLCSLFFSFFTHKDLYGVIHETPEEVHKKWSMKRSIITLLVATAVVALESELLVSNIEPMTEQLHLSKLFVGLIIIPIIGNAAEHATSVIMAMKNKMDISIEISIGSSLQIMLFIVPMTVFISLFFQPMVLIFNVYEILAIGIAVIVANKVCADGESNWIEGLQLVFIYSILAVTFFLI